MTHPISTHTARHGAKTMFGRLLATVACIVVCVCATAQNNIYGINDKLYHIYIQAYKDRANEKGLKLSQ